MYPSVFDVFTIGIGPSSSHSVGPMRAANRFLAELQSSDAAVRVQAVRIELFGSLALTGQGHGTTSAVLLGLRDQTPEGVDPDAIVSQTQAILDGQKIDLPGVGTIPFRCQEHLIAHRNLTLPFHSNAIRFTACDDDDAELLSRTYFSVGGGVIVTAEEAGQPLVDDDPLLPSSFRKAADLLEMARRSNKRISQLTLEDELQRRSEQEVREGLWQIWGAMQNCVQQGCTRDGVLPGGLGVVRRAPKLYRQLSDRPESSVRDPLTVLDWVDLFALAVSEENAAGGRVVTAPTNGAAGIMPAVLHYYDRFCPGSTEEGIIRFLLTAGAIALLYKQNASISGAEVGCQGEVGVACSMAAGALTEVLGGSPAQVEQAAEIGMEHNLGLTCDPVGGLVQVPCIERNAMASIAAINAARLALRGDGRHRVSLDQVIETMRQTGADMQTKYKETSLGGLAVNVPQC